VSAGLQAEVLDQIRCQSMQILMQQTQEAQACCQRDGTLRGLEDRDGAQRPPLRDRMG
jgi:hypothetical protein